MGLARTVAPTVEPLDVEEAKQHLRLESDFPDDNDAVTNLIVVAREDVELDTARALLEQTWALTLDAFPCDDSVIHLAHPPVLSVTGITYVDENGDTQTLATSVYGLDTSTLPPCVYLKYDQVWPTTRQQRNAVTVTYKAGYGTAASSVPAMLKAAMLLKIAHLYENREAVNIGNIVTPIPQGYNDLLSKYRVEVLS